MAEGKLVAQVKQVRDIRIGAKVEKRRGLDPQVLVEVQFSIPAGDITQLGALVNLESEKQKVSVLFFAEETQHRMDLSPEVNHFTYEITEKDGTQEYVTTFRDSDKSWTGKGATLRLATVAAWEQFELPAGELPSFLTDIQKNMVKDIIEGTSERAFDKMGDIRSQIEKEEAAVAVANAPETKPAKQGRRRKKTEIPFGGDNHANPPENIEAITETAQTKGATANPLQLIHSELNIRLKKE